MSVVFGLGFGEDHYQDRNDLFPALVTSLV